MLDFEYIFFWIFFLKAWCKKSLRDQWTARSGTARSGIFNILGPGLIQNFAFSGSEFKSKLVPFRPSPHFLKNNHPNLGNFWNFWSLSGSPCSEYWSYLVCGFLFHGIRVAWHWKVPSFTKDELLILNYFWNENYYYYYWNEKGRRLGP